MGLAGAGRVAEDEERLRRVATSWRLEGPDPVRDRFDAGERGRAGCEGARDDEHAGGPDARAGSAVGPLVRVLPEPVAGPVAAVRVVSSGSPDTTAAADSAPPPLAFRVTGRTVDIQAYTKFLRQLEASPWIENVQPQSVTTVIENERPVTAFVVSANYTTADSAYIRTVPLSQSVR